MVSADAISGVQKCCKIRLRWGSAPGLLGELTVLPQTPSWIKGGGWGGIPQTKISLSLSLCLSLHFMSYLPPLFM